MMKAPIRHWRLINSILLVCGSLMGCSFAQYSALLVPTATLRVPGTPEGKFGGYAYVLLRDANDPQRNAIACKRYLATFSQSDKRGYALPTERVSVAWPVRQRPAVPGLGRNCSWLVQNYDYTFSTKLLQTVKCAKGEAYPSGPVLVAGKTEAGKGGKVWDTDAALVVDLSNVEPSAWVPVFRRFYDQIELGPTQHWGRGWFDRALKALKSLQANASQVLNGRCS